MTAVLFYNRNRYCCHLVRNFGRNLSTGEVAAALRPFYFLVHPDFFAQHPRAQHINDASLKSLNSHLDCLVNRRRLFPLHLQFYVRNQNKNGILESVALELNRSSVKETIHRILSTFNLPTKFVDELQEIGDASLQNCNINWHHSYYDATGLRNPHEVIATAQNRTTLYSWLVSNMGEAERRLGVSELVRQDIERLHHSLIVDLDLASLTWERGLGTTHLRGCLQGLVALTSHHSNVADPLKRRDIHFGNVTGVSLDGRIVFNTSEVRDQWYKGIRQIPEQDVLIRRIPDMQRAVSNALRDITVTSRKYQPFLLGSNYSLQLRRLVTVLGDFRGRNAYPKVWPESLAHLQLVVESASGPLMVSPTGQILTPSSCPPGQLVNFISDHMDEAFNRILKYESLKPVEKARHLECTERLGLNFLDKDDSVSPDMMLDCLDRLLECSERLSPLLTGARLWVTQYYSVMLDGEVCIPWNWDLEGSPVITHMQF